MDVPEPDRGHVNRPPAETGAPKTEVAVLEVKKEPFVKTAGVFVR
jgi:hypothetical protein